MTSHERHDDNQAGKQPRQTSQPSLTVTRAAGEPQLLARRHPRAGGAVRGSAPPDPRQPRRLYAVETPSEVLNATSA